MDDFMRCVERVPVVLMALRLLDHEARYDPAQEARHSMPPYATEWVNLLGDLLHGRHNQARDVHRSLELQAPSPKLLKTIMPTQRRFSGMTAANRTRSGAWRKH